MRRPIPFLGTTRTPRSSPHPVAQRRPPEAWPARRMGTQGTDSTWGSSNFPRTPVYAPFPNPPRHSTSSSAPWQGGPYASLPPIPRPAAPSSYGGYSEGCSGYAPWYAPPMGNDPASSAVPGHPRTRSQSRRQAASPVPDRSSNNDSMASDGGDDDLASASSSGDNAGVIGNTAGVQEEEGDGDNSGSEADGSSSEGDSSWASEGNSSSEVDEEVYKDWEILFEKENPVFQGMKIVMESTRRTTKLLQKAILLGMYHNTYLCKQPRRIPVETGIQWVERTLRIPIACYNMFWMQRHVFELLHEQLVHKYGLPLTSKMCSREALGMFLDMVGPPQPVRQVENRFERFMETVSRKINHVLSCLTKLAKDGTHMKVMIPFFNNAIGAIDGTHVKVMIPFSKVGQYVNRNNKKLRMS
ncbi:uncharacterized protein LOC120699009 isoform X7 [Panicum virgatum]|uniref:uncharacterized protein LOC120699009 isoform X7 n=1 Tax=Panicum virgatum TaxID=38727 RepID=UPI0019D67EAC|nr:uncharacterized protein LOC120699009 isoform X7 [Panicum virgatum]